MPQEDEPVQRTRAASPKELLREAAKWDEAIKKELPQLFEEKQILRRIDEREFKVVITLKPGPTRKNRLVACGNFVDQPTAEGKDQCLYASGADAVC